MSSFDEIRRRFYNEAVHELNEAKQRLSYNDKKLSRLLQEEKLDMRVQIQKSKEYHKDQLVKIDALEQKVDEIQRGLWDARLKEEIDQVAVTIAEKTKVTKTKKKNTRSMLAPQPYVKQQNLYHSTPPTVSQREMDRELGYYYKTLEMYSDANKARLKNMPNNRGFMFRRVWFFGEKPEQPPTDELIMYEYDRQQNKTIEHHYQNRRHWTTIKRDRR